MPAAMLSFLSEHDVPLPCPSLELTRDDAAPADRIRAILVDDDETYRESARAALEPLGFDVVPYARADAMLDHLEKGQRADVIVLNWTFETELGIDILPRLRRRGIDVPVVFLTHSPATAYEYVALERGASDFVDKARGIPILAKRLRLVARTMKKAALQEAREPLQCGRVSLRPDIGRAYWMGKDVGLTVTEFRVVLLLASRAGEYVTYRSIYDCVHHAGFIAGCGEDGFRTNVRSSIRRIRNKFRALDNGFAEIENYAAFGYRWRASPIKPARPAVDYSMTANDTA
ncbi:MAG TPA: response regulator transcription factor [Stellaceae bacterium]|nr:response regulator transcription factor [Stellaceae bacterium]